ncbi:MAG: hypothetical protein ACPH4G_03855 [Henriciella sp.]|nr:hypothetical protein [Hyphomonadaceae bacterium]OUX94422.1 MAG: hypothetical protein CBB77_04830 [Hyphomonas sp. TMED17]CAI8316247.1 MAG: Uncharacterised protein [Hyphomonas sp. TMED17]
MVSAYKIEPGLLQKIMFWINRIGHFLGRALVAFSIIIAAGLLTVAAAVSAITLACMAIIIRLLSRPSSANAEAQAADDDGVTLDARKTPRGWTVE